ncbi:hypothetical protein [Dyadobacter aurulentus]|uniref:hypothetical protein n=1 Tax=Dyadobacter sp. UC 10 TaxID=2605428 RepID=UPI0011F1E0F4|nr:hypothetical protein [Dyadobacter sp. UC 10]KAA0992657.1 hypothetical protein FXO21_22020 [Dyadobacter sp. UC 10]
MLSNLTAKLPEKKNAIKLSNESQRIQANGTGGYVEHYVFGRELKKRTGQDFRDNPTYPFFAEVSVQKVFGKW